MTRPVRFKWAIRREATLTLQRSVEGYLLDASSVDSGAAYNVETGRLDVLWYAGVRLHSIRPHGNMDLPHILHNAGLRSLRGLL